MPRSSNLSAELEIGAGLSPGFMRIFDRLDKRVDKTLRGLRGFNDGIKGIPKGDRVVAGLGRGFEKLTGLFRNTNAEIGRTHSQIGALRKQTRVYESLADHARKAGKAVQPWLEKIDRVNRQLDKQEKKLNHLRVARERLNKATTGFAQVRERVAPGVRRAGYAAAGVGVGAGYAAMRGFQKYSDFDTTLNTLKAEGVSETEIPAIRDQILKFAGETRFTALEIGELLVSMKKDGQEITSELTGFGDLLKFAVAENKDINTAWDVTRTYINATNTSLGNAITLQEELSNATSLSKLQIEDYGFIAGKSLSTFANLENFDTRGFNAIAGLLADTGVQAETVGITLRNFPLMLADASVGILGGEGSKKQGMFDALGINIANEKGQLKDIVTILTEFNRVFTEKGLITDENKISTLGLTRLSGIFDRRYADAIGKMITGSQKIEKSIEGVGKVGTLDVKFKVHSETLFAAQKRFESAAESLGLRLFSIFDDDANFIKMFDGMTKGVDRFARFVEKHKESISKFAKGFVEALGKIGEKAIDIGKDIFKYFKKRGPAIKAFISNFGKDLKGVWKDLKPIVKGVLGVFRQLFDTAGKLAGGNTKLLAWLAAGVIGWQLLKTPVLAANSAFNLVLGSIGKVRAAWTGLKGIETVGNPVIPPSRGPKAKSPKVQKRWGAPLVTSATLAPVPKRGAFGTTQKVTTPPAGRFARIFEKLKLGKLTRFGTLLASFGPMLANLFSKFSFLLPVVGVLGKAFTAVGAAIAGLTAPAWAAVAVIVAAVAGGVALIVANWDKVKLAVGETWESMKLFGSAVWETLKWVGGGVSDFLGWIGGGIKNKIGELDNFLKGFGIDIGGFFKGIFGGIGDGIKNVVSSISDKFGGMLDWITESNKDIQKILGTWKDSMKEKNEARRLQRDGPDPLKLALPTPINNMTQRLRIAPVETAGMLLRKGDRKDKLPDLTKDAENYRKALAKQLSNASEKLGPEASVWQHKITNFVGPALQKMFSEKTKTTEKTEADTPNMPGFNDKAETPNLDIKGAPKEDSFFESGTRFRRDTASVEYVDFAGVDAIDKTLKAGFESLLHINTGILAAVKGVPDISLNTPGIDGRTPEAGLNIQNTEVNPFAAVPVSVQVPPVDIPRPTPITVPNINSSETIDNTREGDTVENHYQITINQLPGEDAEALTDRMLAELEKKGRAGYYD